MSGECFSDTAKEKRTFSGETMMVQLKLRAFACLLAALFVVSADRAAQAQAKYPERTIKFVSPYSPGGVTDVFSRLIGIKLGESWGATHVVENISGAGGNLGTQSVARAAPDGYTLLMGGIGTHAVNPTLFKAPGFDPIKDFAPVIRVIETEGMLVVHPSVPAKNLAELIALARDPASRLSVATGGIGTASHLAAELFKQMAKIDQLPIVHYRGQFQGVNDTLAGQTSIMFANMPTVIQHAKSGTLRPIAVIGGKRSKLMPELPTLAQAGLPGFEISNWFGLFAPARTPPDIVARLNTEVNRIMLLADVQERLIAEGGTFTANTPEDFAAYVKTEEQKWSAFVKATGMSIQ
jgi:tripartite-type tricarboxylate transporter receptor subunit TctC